MIARASTYNPIYDSPRFFKLFGVGIDNETMSEAVEWASQSQTHGRGQVGVFANAHSFTTMWSKPQLERDLRAADRVFPDGVGVRLAAKNLGVEIVENVNGTDMLPLLARRLADKGMSLGLLGARPGVAQAAALNLRAQHPSLRISFVHHGYFESSQEEQIISSINSSGTNVLLVAFGSPVQERWLVGNISRLEIDRGLAVGGLLDFASGRIPRAPEWLRKLEGEWLFRLMQEPKEKWERYVLGNGHFLYRAYLKSTH